MISDCKYLIFSKLCGAGNMVLRLLLFDLMLYALNIVQDYRFVF